ncbi:hypothetical protein H9Q13_13805 [Pontibacter sp. JH31]|uniref:Uncharacterized protein n=1 Tax=Pontibacter aquaedesilientis TaxID=2766980 RepID=A0ABR7XIY5_9BACT|nr:hypothetical protein [Pontibacter aquaedesilientis]MBD1398240.1 hypothetical protein [Pontibacter aquaedesilientis]
MAAGKVVPFLRALGLVSTKRSILMLVLTWVLNLAWLTVNYFWNLVPIPVLIAIPVLLLIYALIALAAYVYWGVKGVREQDEPYANVMVGVIVAASLLYLNYNFFEFILSVIK